MQQVPDEAMSCPHCGYDGTYENESCALPLGSRVNGRYALGKTIDSDGETITYIGFDIPARKRVAIKEYMPASGAVRSGEAVEARQGAEIHYKNGLSDFSELYGSLKLLSYETGMIAVQDFFTANDTAYAVLEQFDGITLREFMDIKKEPLTFDQAMRLFDPVFDALRAIHGAKLIHRGVSPETIYIRKDGAVKLGG